MDIRNGYSKQIPLEGQISGKESTGNDRNIHIFGANVYQNLNYDITTIVLRAHVELKDENWPLFQHFIRLLMDPCINIRSLELIPQKDVLNLLAKAMIQDCDRLQCRQLHICFNGDTQKLIWVKDHVRCDEFNIYGNSDSNYDEELLDLFLTGTPCTSTIYVEYYELSTVIIALVQKSLAFKNSDECQLIESTRGYVEEEKL